MGRQGRPHSNGLGLSIEKDWQESEKLATSRRELVVEHRRGFRLPHALAFRLRAAAKAPTPGTAPPLVERNNFTGATGLEPATSGVTGRRSNQLNYAPRAAAL
jgi:hypothetical protein